MRYRRADVAGGTYFFTVNLAERQRTLLVDHVDVLRDVLREVKVKHPFHICQVPGDHVPAIPRRSYPLFEARAILAGIFAEYERSSNEHQPP